MRTLNNYELAFLAMLGHGELTKTVLELYVKKTYLFTDMFCPHLNMMLNAYMDTLKRNRKQYGLNPPLEVIAAGISEVVQADRTLPDEMREKCDDILTKLQQKDIPDLPTGRRLVSHLVQMEANRKLMSQLQSNAELQELQQSVDASQKLVTALEQVESPADEEEELPAVVKPFKEIDKLAKKVVLIPTGINWLDDVTSGGGRAGEMWLILGPSGGGKTTLTVQYSSAQALMSDDTLWVTYEQSVEGDIAERMIANITDTSLDEIRDIGFDDLDQSIKDKFWAATGGVDDHLVAIDMTRRKCDPSDPEDYGGIHSIDIELQKLKAEGFKPKTVIIDWFGFMMSTIAANLGYDLSTCYRFKAQEEILKALKWAKKEKVLLIFLHQLSNEASDKRPTYLANATEAQDMRSMRNYFTLVMVLGVRDVNDVCWFHSPKARRSARVKRTLQLIGDKQRFIKVDGWLPNKDGNFYNPANSGGGAQDFHGAAEEYSREIE